MAKLKTTIFRYVNQNQTLNMDGFKGEGVEGGAAAFKGGQRPHLKNGDKEELGFMGEVFDLSLSLNIIDQMSLTKLSILFCLKL